MPRGKPKQTKKHKKKHPKTIPKKHKKHTKKTKRYNKKQMISKKYNRSKILKGGVFDHDKEIRLEKKKSIERIKEIDIILYDFYLEQERWPQHTPDEEASKMNILETEKEGLIILIEELKEVERRKQLARLMMKPEPEKERQYIDLVEDRKRNVGTSPLVSIMSGSQLLGAPNHDIYASALAQSGLFADKRSDQEKQKNQQKLNPKASIHKRSIERLREYITGEDELRKKAPPWIGFPHLADDLKHGFLGSEEMARVRTAAGVKRTELLAEEEASVTRA